MVKGANIMNEEQRLSRQKVFIWHVDPGHAWLKVKRNDLIALGIAEDISVYSYRRGEYAYLEEDCDAGIFVAAYRNATGREPEYTNRFADRRSRIRDYGCYVSPIPGPCYLIRPVGESLDKLKQDHYTSDID
jgi:hypothetical protein